MRVLYDRKHQEKMSIELLQAKQGKDDVERLGVFSFGPFVNEQANVPVDFEITYCRDGIVNISASDRERNTKISGITHAEANSNVRMDDLLENVDVA